MDKQAVEEIKQHFGIVAEGLESKIEIIAEGHALLRVEMIKGVEEFRSEVRESFGDVRSMIKLSYTEIDTRIGNLGVRLLFSRRASSRSRRRFARAIPRVPRTYLLTYQVLGEIAASGRRVMTNQ